MREKLGLALLTTTVLLSTYGEESHASIGEVSDTLTYEESVKNGLINPEEMSKEVFTKLKAQETAAIKDVENDEVEKPVDANGFEEQGAFSPKAGDILLTNDTKFSPFVGHTAIYIGKGQIVEILGKGYTSEINYYKDFIRNHTNRYGEYVKIYRPASETAGAKAAAYAKNNLLGSSYKIDQHIKTKNPTYCSKIVWQAYNKGNDASYTRWDDDHIVPPHLIKAEIMKLKSKPVYEKRNLG